MTLLELLAAVREPYTELLASAVAGGHSHIEPAFRNQDGELAREGALSLPCRADLIPRSGRTEPATIDSKMQLSFEPFRVNFGACEVTITPFKWDWTQISIPSGDVAAISTLLVQWFDRWFDPEDTNDLTDEGLYGVVHFSTEPKEEAGIVRLAIDLGSAPVQALDDLLKHIAGSGATTATVA